MNKGCPEGLIHEFSWITILVGFSVNVKIGHANVESHSLSLWLGGMFQVRLGALKTAVVHDANN